MEEMEPEAAPVSFIDQASRTGPERPRSSVQFNAMMTMAIAVCCRSSVWSRKPSPTTRL